MKSKKVVKKKIIRKDPVQELVKKVEELQREIEELKRKKNVDDVLAPYKKIPKEEPFDIPWRPWRHRPHIEYWLYQTHEKSPHKKLLDGIVFYV